MAHNVIKKSGSLIEFWKYEYSARVITRKARNDRPSGGYRKAHTRRHDNVRRSVSLFRRIVRSNIIRAEHPALLTLTMLQIVSLKASSRFLTEFIVRCRGRFGKNFRYVAVPEYQKRGAIHYHLLIWGLPEENICHGYWRKYKGKNVFFCTDWENGTCECSTRTLQRLWVRGLCDCIETDGSIKLAGYLSKYLSKAMRDDRFVRESGYTSQKAYHCSRNVLRPVRAASAEISDVFLSALGVTETPTHVHKFKTQWMGECTYQAYENEEDLPAWKLAQPLIDDTIF